jgi:uncharacterized protein YlxP (DUF503 family)
MFIGYLRVNLFIPDSRSLKDRRRVLEGVKQKVRNNFNVSIAQEPSDTWKNCELYFACVNHTKNSASDLMEQIQNFINSEGNIRIIEAEKGVL